MGPWTKIVEGEFSDPSQEEDIKEFPLSKPQTGQFVNFRCVSWYRHGCLLQYIGFGLDFKNQGVYQIKVYSTRLNCASDSMRGVSKLSRTVNHPVY